MALSKCNNLKPTSLTRQRAWRNNRIPLPAIKDMIRNTDVVLDAVSACNGLSRRGIRHCIACDEGHAKWSHLATCSALALQQPQISAQIRSIDTTSLEDCAKRLLPDHISTIAEIISTAQEVLPIMNKITRTVPFPPSEKAKIHRDNMQAPVPPHLDKDPVIRITGGRLSLPSTSQIPTRAASQQIQPSSMSP